MSDEDPKPLPLAYAYRSRDYDTQACRDARRQAWSPDWKLPRDDDDLEDC